MPAAIPIPIGGKYGRLTITRAGRARTVVCKCDCGAELLVSFKSLRTPSMDCTAWPSTDTGKLCVRDA